MLPATMAVLGLPGPRPPDTHDIKKLPIVKDDVYDMDQVYEPTVFSLEDHLKAEDRQDRSFKKLLVIGKTGTNKSTLCNRIAGQRTDAKLLSLSAKVAGCIQFGAFSFKTNIQKRDKHSGNQSKGKGEQNLVHEGLFSDPSHWQKMTDVQHSGDKTSCDTMELNNNNFITTTTTEENSDINQQKFHLPFEVMESEAGQYLQDSVDTKLMTPPQKMSTEQPVRENLAGWLGKEQVLAGRPRLEEWQTSQEADCTRMEPADWKIIRTFTVLDSIIWTFTVLDSIIWTCAVLDSIIRVTVVSSIVVMARREDEYKMRKMTESKENLKELVA